MKTTLCAFSELRASKRCILRVVSAVHPLSPGTEEEPPEDVPLDAQLVGRRVRVEWFDADDCSATSWHEGWVTGYDPRAGTHRVAYDRRGPDGARRHAHVLRAVSHEVLSKPRCSDRLGQPISEQDRLEILRLGPPRATRHRLGLGRIARSEPCTSDTF